MRPVVIVKTGTAVANVLAEHRDFEALITAGMGLSSSQVLVSSVYLEESLPDPRRISAAVVTGSSAMVTDRAWWSERTAAWLRETVDLVCSDGALGATCYLDEDCTGMPCGAGQCTDGSNGSTCDDNAECDNGHCYESVPDDGICSSGAVDQLCAENADCALDHCPVDSPQVCTAGAQNDRCQNDTHCEATCNTGNNRCH